MNVVSDADASLSQPPSLKAAATFGARLLPLPSITQELIPHF